MTFPNQFIVDLLDLFVEVGCARIKLFDHQMLVVVLVKLIQIDTPSKIVFSALI